ncbi:MAG: zinc ABC transporter substrate-binding protein [Methanothrix sp.]|nr:zinc ABC transporter substrate-binding protein [Methanothrix sp.]
MIWQLLVILALTALCGCISQDAPSERVQVVTTIAPLGDFVRGVGGDRVDVTVLVPPGAEPHTFEPTPAQMKSLDDADLYVMNGAGLEYWIDRVLDLNGEMVVLDSSEGIDLVSEEGGGVDPHIWTSLKNAEIQVRNICEGLIQVDPEGRDQYEANRDRYIQRLALLDEMLNGTYSRSSKRIFIVDHPAWTYFARDYGLVQVALMEGEREPGPRYLGEVIDLARQNNITRVFVEPEFNPKSAEVIAREMGAQIIVLDPLAEGYLQNMQHVGESIAESLR